MGVKGTLHFCLAALVVLGLVTPATASAAANADVRAGWDGANLRVESVEPDRGAMLFIEPGSAATATVKFRAGGDTNLIAGPGCTGGGYEMECSDRDMPIKAVFGNGADRISVIGDVPAFHTHSVSFDIQLGGGDDYAALGSGSDVVDAGHGYDEVYGGEGDDTFHMRDLMGDEINCGPGRDDASDGDGWSTESYPGGNTCEKLPDPFTPDGDRKPPPTPQAPDRCGGPNPAVGCPCRRLPGWPVCLPPLPEPPAPMKPTTTTVPIAVHADTLLDSKWVALRGFPVTFTQHPGETVSVHGDLFFSADMICPVKSGYVNFELQWDGKTVASGSAQSAGRQADQVELTFDDGAPADAVRFPPVAVDTERTLTARARDDCGSNSGRITDAYISVDLKRAQQ
jgi:hypothetical protein